MDKRFKHMQEIMLGYDFEPEPSNRENSWLLPNLVVQVGEAGQGGFLGIIREILDDGMCLVAVHGSNDGEHVVVSPSEVKKVPPNIMDEVKIVKGKFRRMTGQLVDIRDEGVHGVVLLDSVNQMKFVKMAKIGKLDYIPEPVENIASGSGTNSPEKAVEECEHVQQKSMRSPNSRSAGKKDELKVAQLVKRENGDSSLPNNGGECSRGIRGDDDRDENTSPRRAAQQNGKESELMETENVDCKAQANQESEGVSVNAEPEVLDHDKAELQTTSDSTARESRKRKL